MQKPSPAKQSLYRQSSISANTGIIHSKMDYCKYRIKDMLIVMLYMFAFILSCEKAHSSEEVPIATLKSIQVSAVVQDNPAQISLVWNTISVYGDYSIYRRTTGPNTSWGDAITTLPNNATGYTDNDVSVGVEYEYKISLGTKADGYIRAGIKIPLKDNKGKVIFLVESGVSAEMPDELMLMEKMMVADGWQVVRAEVARDDSVPSVKSVIQALYNQDPQNTKALYLFGNIPVPYSGNFAPDGHNTTADAFHKGAWPADVYYGDIDGNWTDSSVYNTTASHTGDPTRNHNIPGDGKFDQIVAPSTVELAVGRVDLSKLPAMGEELDLLKNYINKNYLFRYKNVSPERRALVYDGFEWTNGTPSADVYREAAAFFGQDKITDVASGEFLPAVSATNYLWAHGEGGGWFVGAGGVGQTTDIVSNGPKATFYTIFGSWFGDWDSPSNNFLKAFIATEEYGLVNVWSGWHHWFAQDMGLGYDIGHAIKLFHNNSSDTDKGYTLNILDCAMDDTWVRTGRTHMTIMGDPTLRLHMVSPVSNVTANANGLVSWTASDDTDIVGYHVYKSSSELGPYERLTTELVTGTSYVDNSVTADNWYMVRAVKLEISGSGSYYNPSQGIMVKVGEADAEAPAAITDLTVSEPTSSTLTLAWTATGDDGSLGTATSYDFRVSTEAITEENFSSATQLQNIVSPQESGNAESLLVENLSAETEYYFAVKVSDESANTSSISNIANGTTLDKTTYNLTVTAGSGSGEYEEGVTVEITADEALEGLEFDSWTGDTEYLEDASSSVTSLVMPDSDISITAIYRDIVVVNSAPQVSAGSDQEVTLPDDSITLVAVISDDGLPAGSTLDILWSVVSGPDSVVFDNEADAQTTATFYSSGVYVLRITADDGELSGYDEITITVNAEQINVKSIITPVATGNADGGAYFPIQNAFDNQPTWDDEVGEPISSDDGNTAPYFSSRYGYIDFGPDWEKVRIQETWTQYLTWSSGDQTGYDEMWWDDDKDTVNDNGITESVLKFSTAQGLRTYDNTIWLKDVDCSIEPVTPKGRYLILKSSSNMVTRAKEYAFVGYIITEENNPPTVAAGNDLEITLPINTVALSGVVTDDSLPVGTTISTQWSFVSGPAVVSFSDASSLSTTATFTESGVYVLRLTADDTELTVYDDVTITVQAALISTDIITPVAAGEATGSAYFPLENAFDNQPIWDEDLVKPVSSDDGAAGLCFSSRYGYIDFGPDWKNVRIQETWTQYIAWSSGDQTGYEEMWWDDDKDTVNDNGIEENVLKFNSAQGLRTYGNTAWVRDLDCSSEPVTPKGRYLILKSSANMTTRAMEYAFTGYIE